MAPVSCDLVHRAGHSEWSTKVSESSLGVMLRLTVTAKGDTRADLGQQISSDNGAITAMERIVTCEECKGGELQMKAMQILTQLCMDETTNRAEILEHLCIQYTENGQYLSTLKDTMTGLMPKVLREILSGLTEEENPGYARSGTDVESQVTTNKNYDNRTSSSPRQNKHHKLHVSLLSLCVTACDNLHLDLNTISLGGGDQARDQGECVVFSVATKMVQLNRDLINADNLKAMKLITRMVIAAMKRLPDHDSVVERVELESFMDSLSSISDHDGSRGLHGFLHQDDDEETEDNSKSELHWKRPSNKERAKDKEEEVSSKHDAGANKTTEVKEGTSAPTASQAASVIDAALQKKVYQKKQGKKPGSSVGSSSVSLPSAKDYSATKPASSLAKSKLKPIPFDQYGSNMTES
ncbi:hypothetical protein ACQ4PT_013587 [Festuca glaucescens]